MNVDPMDLMIVTAVSSEPVIEPFIPPAPTRPVPGAPAAEDGAVRAADEGALTDDEPGAGEALTELKSMRQCLDYMAKKLRFIERRDQEMNILSHEAMRMILNELENWNPNRCERYIVRKALDILCYFSRMLRIILKGFHALADTDTVFDDENDEDDEGVS